MAPTIDDITAKSNNGNQEVDAPGAVDEELSASSVYSIQR